MHAPHHHHPAAHSQAAAPAAPLPAGTVYTCPMHPEIRQPNPGNCPKCGMTLEPVMPEAEEQDNPELADFQCNGALAAAKVARKPPREIAAAVVDALAHLGVRHVDMPCTSERVWAAIQSAR